MNPKQVHCPTAPQRPSLWRVSIFISDSTPMALISPHSKSEDGRSSEEMRHLGPCQWTMADIKRMEILHSSRPGRESAQARYDMDSKESLKFCKTEMAPSTPSQEGSWNARKLSQLFGTRGGQHISLDWDLESSHFQKPARES